MTISSTANKAIRYGNGVATSFPYKFLIPNQSQLTVIVTDPSGNQTTLTAAQYSVSGINSPNGGAVTYPLSGSPLAALWSITILRTLPIVQLTDIVNQSGFFPDVVESAMDYQTMTQQQLSEAQSRSVSFPVVDDQTAITPVLPAAAARATKPLIFDASGNVTTGATAYQEPQSLLDQAKAVAETLIAGVIGGFGYFLQDGIAAIFRTFQDKMRDSVSVKDWGAKGDNVTDDTAAIMAAAAAAKTKSKDLYFPAGNYLHSSLITLDSILAYGNGARTQLIATDTTATNPQHAVVLTGTAPGLRSMRVTTTWASGRQSNDNAASVLVSNADDFEVVGVRTVGSANVGIGLRGATNGMVNRCRVRTSLADGIAVLDSCSDLTISANLVDSSGDDCISVVSGSTVMLSTRIAISGNVVKNGGARGVTVAGGDTIGITGNVIFNATNAGVQLCVDASHSTQGATNIAVNGNNIISCGSNNPYYGAVNVVGSAAYPASDIVIAGNNIRNSNNDAIQLGAGGGVYVSNVVVDGNNINTSTNQKNGVFISGAADVSITSNKIRGVGQAVLCALGGGTLSIQNNSSRALNPGNVNFYDTITVNGGSTFDAIIVTGNIDVAPQNALRRFLTAQYDEVTYSGNYVGTLGYSVGAGNSGTSRQNDGPNYRTMIGTAAPTAGTFNAGDRVRNPTANLANPVAEWTCRASGTPGTWRPTKWLVVYGPTSSRPTLGATEQGVGYLDTTLSAQGKPITWNGTYWVDGTGTIV
ncbi:right-handed parallel beta-helix repeat-containing protein [Paraburkholderia sediminicola]|uniref:right-handed parallel beta-helix repeat-containing protein n=1 Tax=Paraburkholderia sediminicola TaxID=458836 RepID=UPI0038B91605